MKQELIEKAYEVARERYAAYGIDTEAVLDVLQRVPLSLHCWQADDVTGFESAGELTGGIQATGNYPGKARNIEELRQDILKAASLIPGKHRLNIHEIYDDKRYGLTHAVDEDVRKTFGDIVFKTVVPRNVRVSEAPSHGKPALFYDFKSPGAQAYLRVATEVVQRTEGGVNVA